MKSNNIIDYRDTLREIYKKHQLPIDIFLYVLSLIIFYNYGYEVGYHANRYCIESDIFIKGIIP